MATPYSPLRPRGDTFNALEVAEDRFGADQDVARGLVRTAVGMTASGLADEALRQELAQEEGWQRRRDDALRTQQEAAAYAPRVSSLRDANGIGDIIDFAQGAGPGAAVSTLPALAAGVLARGPAAPLAYAGAAALSYFLSRGEIAGEQYADPTLAQKSVEERDRAATLGGAGMAALESIVPGGLANSLLRKPAQSFLGHVAKDAVTEGVTEAAQTGVQHLANQQLDPNRQLDGWDVVDSAVAGALGGGGLSAATRAPSHLIHGGVDAIRNRFPGSQEPPAAAADPAPPQGPVDPNVPLLPAPETLGSRAEDIYASMSERFGPAAQEFSGKAKDFASEVMDRANEAIKNSETPQDFIRQVFRPNAEAQAAADLRPDADDPGILEAADPAAAMQQRDLDRASRAAGFAEELLADPATPQMIRDRIGAMGGDFSADGNQAYVASTYVAVKGGQKIVDAIGSLSDFAKSAFDKAKTVAEDVSGKITKKNLQDIGEADIQPVVGLLAQRLGPAKAADAPKLARQLVAAANRLAPDAKITADTDKRLRTFSEAVDDEVLDAVTEASGSDGLRNAIAKIRAIPSAESDVRQANGSSFLQSMLKQPLDSGTTANLARFIDTMGLQMQGMSPARKNQVLGTLASAFGSKREAQVVVEYYGNMKREAFRREAESGKLHEDRVGGVTEMFLDQPNRAPEDSYEGAASTAEWGALTENDGPGVEYGFRSSAAKRPFRKFAGERLSSGTNRREAWRAINDARGREDADYGTVDYSEYLANQGVEPTEGLAMVRRDIESRIAEHEGRKGEDRSAMINELRGELELLESTASDKGEKAALDMYEVTSRSARGAQDYVATDDDLKSMQVANKAAPETVVTFRRADGKTLKLSASSMVKALGLKRKQKGGVSNPKQQSNAQMFADAVASVLARDDINGLVSDLRSVVLDPKSGIAVERSYNPDRLAALTRFEKMQNEKSGGVPARRAFIRAQLYELESQIDELGQPDDANFDMVAFENLQHQWESMASEAVSTADQRVASTKKARDKALERYQSLDGPGKREAYSAFEQARATYDYARGGLQDYRSFQRDVSESLQDVQRELDAAEKSGVPGSDTREGAIYRTEEDVRSGQKRQTNADTDAQLKDDPEKITRLDSRGEVDERGTEQARKATGGKQKASARDEEMAAWYARRVEEARTDSVRGEARVVLPKTSRYAAKDQAKSDRANKFIGRGAPGSSTAAYAEAWGERANTGVYDSDDVVFISVNGNRPGALSPPWPEIKKAMSAGATLITDVPADRSRSFNTGERAVADFLDDNGYFEESPGTWVRGHDIDNATGQKRYAPLGKQERVSKQSFVGATADPKGAAEAGAALDAGQSAEAVWSNLGWFRGPDGKLRKEIRSPVLNKRIRDLFESNDFARGIKLGELFSGVSGFEAYAKTDLANVTVIQNEDISDGGFAGVFVPEGEGVIYLTRRGARLAVLVDRAGPKMLKDAAEWGANSMDGFIDMLTDKLDIGSMELDRLANEQMLASALHEMQHAIQKQEGFENGGTPELAMITKYGDIAAYLKAGKDNDWIEQSWQRSQASQAMLADIGPDADPELAAHALYLTIVGEAEAHDVEKRMKLTDAEAKGLAPALADAKREFLHSAVGMIALAKVQSGYKQTTIGGKRKPPNAKEHAELKKKLVEEIRRIRGNDVRVRFNRLIKHIGASGEFSMNADKTDRLIEVAVNAADPMGVAWHESLHDFFGMLDEDKAGRSIKRDLIAASNAPHVKKRLRELLKDHPKALEQIEQSAEERVAYMYQFWAAGELTLGPTGTGIFEQLRQFFRDLFHLVGRDERAADLLTALHEGQFADPSVVAEVLADMPRDRAFNRLERAMPALTDTLQKLAQVAPDRLRAFQNDQLNELADMFSSEEGELGFVQRRFQRDGEWTNKLAGILAGTTATQRREALENLQAMKQPSGKLENELAEFFRNMHGYMTDAGVQTFDSQQKKWVPLRQVNRYFPRNFERDKILKDRAGFRALLMKHGGMTYKAAENTIHALTHGTGQLDLVENEKSLGFSPYAKAVQDRQLTFIDPSNAADFAKYQSKDLADITTMYVKQAVHRAEYARMFGNSGEKITELIGNSGITDKKELEDVSNIVQGLEGTLGYEMSAATKELMSGVMTLQNVVLLPLAIFSQMIDPVVLAARSGELRDVGNAYMTAIKRLGKNKADGEDLAEMLGIVSQDTVLDAMGVAYGTTHMSKRMRNINRVFFKYNGMQGWNNSMRIAATAAGERYILQNRNNKDALAELGLEPSDIKTKQSYVGKQTVVNGKTTGRERLIVSDPKVKEAMFRFVDQAVLRPSSSNRPVWMSDPKFLLLAHLKQFTFAMHNVVLKRANQQLDEGNPKPWGILMLAMPTILAADMAKFALTGGPPPGWGAMDFIVHAVERSGLLGLGDFGAQALNSAERGKLPGEELLGPSFENLADILRWMGGAPGVDAGDVIDRTVPGARFI